MSGASVSVCYIVKNEEQFLDASLSSVRSLATEIILVDTGSTDSTVAIARKHSVRVESFRWVDDFSAARNFAASFARGDWILFVDGDEILETEGTSKIQRLLSSPSDTVAYGVLQRNYTNDRSYPSWHPISTRHQGEVSILSGKLEGFVDNLMMKLYRNHLGLQFEGVLHETIVGSCRKLGLKHLESPVCILHHLKELKSEGFRREKEVYYLKLAMEKLRLNSEHENPWFEVGISFSNLGRYAEAEKAFSEALKKRPDWAEAKLFKARILLHLERYSEAEELLRGVLVNSNLGAEVRGHLSTALLYQGKFTQCQELIEESLRLGASTLSLHISAGTLFFEKKDYLRSRQHWLEALKLNSSDSFLREALQKVDSALKLA